MLALLDRFSIPPQYLSLLLSEPGYWTPGEFASIDEQCEVIRMGELEHMVRCAFQPTEDIQTSPLNSLVVTYTREKYSRVYVWLMALSSKQPRYLYTLRPKKRLSMYTQEILQSASIVVFATKNMLCSSMVFKS